MFFTFLILPLVIHKRRIIMPMSQLVLRINKIALMRPIAQDAPNVTFWQNLILQIQDINVSTGEKKQFFPFPCIQSLVPFRKCTCPLYICSPLSEEMGEAQVKTQPLAPLHTH